MHSGDSVRIPPPREKGYGNPVQSLAKSVSILRTGPKLVQTWMSPVVRWTAQPVFRDPALVDSTQKTKGRSLRERGRRALNLTVALASVVLAFPLFLAIALAVKLSSPGPIFFHQDRIGLNRRRRSADRRKRGRGGADRRGGDSGCGADHRAFVRPVAKR